MRLAGHIKHTRGARIDAVLLCVNICTETLPLLQATLRLSNTALLLLLLLLL